MQKRFYYNLLKKLFPAAVFFNASATIGFPHFIGGHATNIGAGATRFYSLDADSTSAWSSADPSDFSNGEVELAFLAAAGTFDLLNAICNNPAGTGEFFKLTICKNGVATALTISINYPNTTATDTTHSVTTEEGDLVSIKIEGAATTGSFNGSWHIRFTPTA